MRTVESDLRVSIRIDNYDHIAMAYGSQMAERMRDVIQRSLAALTGVDCTIASNERDRLHIEILSVAGVFPESADPMTSDALIEFLLMMIGSTHFEIDGLPLLAVPSVVRVHTRDSRYPVEWSDAPCSAGPILSTSGWCLNYRQDMKRAAVVFEAMKQDRIQLAWQPVRHASAAGEILYQECLMRIIDGDGKLLLPGDFIPALERLGLMRPIDRFVVSHVVENLRAGPFVTLAANVSAQSVVNDFWWHSVHEALAAAPNIATRLIFEITESSDFISISSAIEFNTAMRKLGCRIAVDDFGMGHASLHNLIALKPDMVKVDAFYVRWSEQTSATQAGLSHLIGLLGALAPIVIVEGVSTDDQSNMVLNAGAVWQQGYHLGRPTVVRPSTYSNAVLPSVQPLQWAHATSQRFADNALGHSEF